MQRLAITLSAFLIIVVMIINLALFRQNTQLRSRLVAPQPTVAAASAEQAARITQLEQELKRSEDDRIKATRDATAAHNQLSQLQNATQERDALKAQLQTLQQENGQLRTEVGNLQTMNTINGQVTPLRNLTPTSTVPRTFMNHDQLRTYFTDLLDKEWPPEAEAREQAILRALDMSGGDGNLRQAQIDSMVKNILGFYDQRTKQLVVVTNRATMGVRDRVTYAHEFTHSLQDQHYDLTALFAQTEGNADAQLALKGLVEGDATLTMSLYARNNLSDLDIANYQLEEIASIDLSGLTFGPVGPQVESATYFPYREGTSFVALLYQQGGWKAVNAAFARPPRSTEQVLHPDRYLAGDAPVAVQLPALAPAGWRVLAEDTLGELYMRIYLERGMSFDEAAYACTGWGGDRYQVLGDDQGHVALALSTVWDTAAAAQRFADAAGVLVSQLGNASLAESAAQQTRWQLPNRQFLIRLNGKRVVVLHAPDAATLNTLAARIG
ncbi:MAG TPA: hypothetical protein PKK78_12600 [Kouleothrix sp.]|jgi:hypothetical protein|nr:hypothetical protein [Kouleothrix sp.]